MVDLIIILVIISLIMVGLLYKKHMKRVGKSSCGCNCKNCSLTCSSKEKYK